MLQQLASIIAKFHYTDTDTDTDFFAAKLRWVRAGPFRRKKVRVRVRVVEFSFYCLSVVFVACPTGGPSRTTRVSPETGHHRGQRVPPCAACTLMAMAAAADAAAAAAAAEAVFH